MNPNAKAHGQFLPRLLVERKAWDIVEFTGTADSGRICSFQWHQRSTFAYRNAEPIIYVVSIISPMCRGVCLNRWISPPSVIMSQSHLLHHHKSSHVILRVVLIAPPQIQSCSYWSIGVNTLYRKPLVVIAMFRAKVCVW